MDNLLVNFDCQSSNALIKDVLTMSYGPYGTFSWVMIDQFR